jgi:hypothetical protein
MAAHMLPMLNVAMFELISGCKDAQDFKSIGYYNDYLVAHMLNKMFWYYYNPFLNDQIIFGRLFHGTVLSK